jgi:diguanylate cyclase (GGDEF)-like protein
MSLTLKFIVESEEFEFTVYGYLNNGKPVCVVTQHDRSGNLPLSANDTDWASDIWSCTTEASMNFGEIFPYRDFTWIEYKPFSGEAGSRFEVVTFDVTVPDDQYPFIQEISSPTRQTIAQELVEHLIGEPWNPDRNPYGADNPLLHIKMLPPMRNVRVITEAPTKAEILQACDIEEILQTYDITGLVDGWYFKKREDSPGFFIVAGRDLAGSSILMSGDSVELLLQECIADATRISKSLNMVSDLPNFKQFESHIQNYLDNREEDYYPLAVILINLDFFRHINHGLGRKKGDKILCSIGSMLESVGNKYASITYHSQSEFGTILTNGDKSRISSYLEEVHAGIKDLGIRYEYREEDRRLWVDASAIHGRQLSMTSGVATAIKETVVDARALLLQAYDNCAENKELRWRETA